MGHGQKLVVLCLHNRKGTHWSNETSKLYRPPILTIYYWLFQRLVVEIFSIHHMDEIVLCHDVYIKSVLVNTGQKYSL